MIMGFSLKHSFVVKAPVDRVWAFLTDPHRVAAALPGAAISDKVGDDAYAGTITVKVGPVSARYRGKVRFDSLDVAARSARIVATGQDTSGRGGADMCMSSRLVELGPGETEVSFLSEVSVTGILAQFGRGMIQDVSNQMVGRFTEVLRADLEKPAAEPAEAAPPPRVSTPPIGVLSSGARGAGRAAARLLRRPLFWVAVLVLVLIVWFLSR
jgi:carbon monoxide dehydrogenase subunit G